MGTYSTQQMQQIVNDMKIFITSFLMISKLIIRIFR